MQWKPKLLSSVLWHCSLGDRKGIRPVKTERWDAGVVICLDRGADLHMAQRIPLPLTVSCFSKIQIGFTFLVPAYPGSPGQRAVKRVCACACSENQSKATNCKSSTFWKHCIAVCLANSYSHKQFFYSKCIMFGDWALPRPMWGAYSTPLNPLAVFKGAALRQGRTEKGEKG